jgi:hypothetical protein
MIPLRSTPLQNSMPQMTIRTGWVSPVERPPGIEVARMAQIAGKRKVALACPRGVRASSQNHGSSHQDPAQYPKK